MISCVLLLLNNGPDVDFLHYPDVDPRSVFNMKCTANHLEVYFSLPESNEGWRCPFCPAALPEGIRRNVLEKARKKHYNDKHKSLKNA